MKNTKESESNNIIYDKIKLPFKSIHLNRTLNRQTLINFKSNPYGQPLRIKNIYRDLNTGLIYIQPKNTKNNIAINKVVITQFVITDGSNNHCIDITIRVPKNEVRLHNVLYYNSKGEEL